MIFDCIVVGGGVIGMMTAWQLHQAGLKHIAVIERGQAGLESSWAGGGILSPLYPWHEDEDIHPLARWGQDQYPLLTEELKSLSKIDPEWIRSGYLILDVESHDLDQALRCSNSWGYEMEILECDEIHRKFPSISTSENKALWLAKTAQIRPPKLIKALKKTLEILGVIVIEHEGVQTLLMEKEKAIGVQTCCAKYYSETVLIAAGAWSSTLLNSFGIQLDIEPVRGQIILYKPPTELLKPIVIRNGKYLIPRQDGSILVGSTIERVGFQKDVTEQAAIELKESAEFILPDLSNLQIKEHWSGLRPGTKRGVPYLDKISQIENLFLSSGHFRNGILMAPASAKIMTDIIMNRPSSFHLPSYIIEI